MKQEISYGFLFVAKAQNIGFNIAQAQNIKQKRKTHKILKAKIGFWISRKRKTPNKKGKRIKF